VLEQISILILDHIQLGMSEKRGDFFQNMRQTYTDRPQLHILVNVIWYVFGGWDSTAVI